MKEFLISLERNGEKPLYFQIYEYFKAQIINGTLKENSKLPSIRVLSSQLNLNKVTIETAYDQLMMEGFIRSQARSGFYVERLNIDYFKKRKLSSVKPKPKKHQMKQYKYDFCTNRVDSEHFPLETWRKISNECLQYHFQDVYFQGNPQGEQGLRKEIATYIKHSRGVSCTDNQIIIGCHSQFLISLLCDIIGQKAITVAVGEPGYMPVTNVFERLGFNIATVKIGVDGLNQEELIQSKAKMVFTQPSHQFPFGHIMSIQKRIQLLDWANREEAYIIEDDYLSEFRFSGSSVPSLQGLDVNERVIYIGTFYGTLLPSIGMGFMVLPNHLIKKYFEYFDDIQQTTSRIHQKTLELFIKGGYWERHIFRMKNLYRKKYEFMVKTIQNVFQERVTIINGLGGLHVVMKVNGIYQEQELLKIARSHGVNLISMSETCYCKEIKKENENTFLLGFGGLSMTEIEQGINLLSNAWELERV